MTADELTVFRARLVSAVTDDDRKQGEREAKRGYRVNIYRLGIMLGAVDECMSAIESGTEPAEAFAAHFTPSRENHATARKLKLGLDVVRGRWCDCVPESK